MTMKLMLRSYSYNEKRSKLSIIYPVVISAVARS